MRCHRWHKGAGDKFVPVTLTGDRWTGMISLARQLRVTSCSSSSVNVHTSPGITDTIRNGRIDPSEASQSEQTLKGVIAKKECVLNFAF